MCEAIQCSLSTNCCVVSYVCSTTLIAFKEMSIHYCSYSEVPLHSELVIVAPVQPHNKNVLMTKCSHTERVLVMTTLLSVC